MAGKLARRAGVGGGESVWNVISRRRAQSHIVANPAPVSSACGAIACFLPVESPEMAANRPAALEITRASPMCLKRRADSRTARMPRPISPTARALRQFCGSR